MSDVDLRCPHCGTIQAAAGECEACHEDEVRYYCRNHAPGRWLDGPACPDCGARFGVERRPAPEPVRPRAPMPPASRRRPGGEPPPARVPDETEPWPVRERRPTPRYRGGHARGPVPEPPFAEPPFAEPPWTTVDPGVAARVVARGALGCVGRLVMLVIVLIVLAMLLVGGFLSGAFGAAPRQPAPATVAGGSSVADAGPT